VTDPERASEPGEAGVPGGGGLARPLPHPPEDVRWIVRTLEARGYETWAVGGAVRDALMGMRTPDWDMATRATPQEVRRIFRRTVPVGIQHGTVGILARDGTLYEVTTFRRDVETFGRHAVVEFADTVEEDLSRRDFTINALAWHPLREEILDPFGGRDDLARRVLRTVGEPRDRFAEDYLRVLRALRFAGRFDLSVEERTWSALRDAVAELHTLSPERIREELTKVLDKDPRPSGALALFASSGVLAKVFPELAGLVELPCPGPGSDEDAWSFAARAADAIPVTRPDVRLAALLMDVGVPGREAGADEASGTAPEQEESVPERAARRAAALLMRLRYSNARIDRVVGIVRAGVAPPDADAPDARWRRWLSQVGPERVPDLIRVWGGRCRAHRGGAGGARCEVVVAAWRRARGILRSRPPLAVADLALDGRDLIRLGLKPGPDFGRILEWLLDQVLEEPGINRGADLEALIVERVRQGWAPPRGGEGGAE